MQNPLAKLTALALLVGTTTLAITACTSDDSSSNGSGNTTPAQDVTYNGPGSKWDVTFRTAGTFTVTKRANTTAPVDFTVDGTYTTSTTGFKILTVTSVTGTGGPSAGDKAWAIDVPRYALLLSPMESGSDQVIPMVASGSCPTADFAANWVIVKKSNSSDATSSSRDFFGSYQYDASTSTATLPSVHALDNAFTNIGANSLGASTCQDGIAQVSDAVMYLTTNGGAIVHTQVSNPSEASFIFALAQKSITNVANFDGAYAGMVFDGNFSAGARLIPAGMTCTSGTCSGHLLSGAETGATASDPWTLALTNTVDSPSAGLITGTLTDNGSANTGNVACMIDTDVLDTSKKIMSCVGQSPGDNTQMVNAIFASK